MYPARILRKYGVRGTLNKIRDLSVKHFLIPYYLKRYADAPRYIPPTEEELSIIENDLGCLDISIHDYYINKESFEVFITKYPFPADFYAGDSGNVRKEKLLEHFIAYDFCIKDLSENDIYIDIASSSSPWVRILRNNSDISAYGIDLEILHFLKKEPYYLIQDATSTTFDGGSVSCASLQCAYEMFMNDDDILLLHELSRILKNGGKAVILPLYMHTHYCTYSTPEYWGKGHSPTAAREYIRADTYGVMSSRKYDALTLKKRVLDTINLLGMTYRIFVLRNKIELGKDIYCHFILEITK